MKIQSIIKRKYTDKCIILFEGKYEKLEFSLDLVIKYSLSKGSKLTPNLLKKLLKEQSRINCKQKAFRYATRGKKSEFEVRNNLKQKKFTKEEIEIAIKFLYDFNLLDDYEFAKVFIDDYLKRKPCGEKKLYYELLKKGIDKQIAQQSLELNFPKDDNFLMALRAAEKKMRLLKNKQIEKQKKSLTDYLFRQGFTYEVIKKVIEKIFI